jgi:tRNA dimethylallyltransferase
VPRPIRCFPTPSALKEPLYICGPTASGKSAVALHLARVLGGEIVNADAFQLYRGLEVLTASPDPEEFASTPHHLYSVIDPSENLDAARYRELALPVIHDIQDRGRQPIIVGGSGLYLKFLTHGPSPLPPADPDLRRELEALPLDELNRRLAELDPDTAATIDRQNPRYVQRALEVCIVTGQPVSRLRRSFSQDPGPLRGIVLHWDPAALDQRIRQRTTAMLVNGAIDEVAAHPKLSTTASKAIGIRQIRALMNGHIDHPACEEKIVIATRRYAKRQRTWFRRESWLTPVPGHAPPEEILRRCDCL